MFCTNCGNEMPDEALFCTNCGQRFERDPEPEAAEAPGQPVEADADESAGQEQGAASDDVPAVDEPPADATTVLPASAMPDAEPEAEGAAVDPFAPQPLDKFEQQDASASFEVPDEALDQPEAATTVIPRQDADETTVLPRRCPACGAEVPAGSHFCTECGKRVDQPQPAQAEPQAGQPATFTCPHCGKEHPADMRFCTETGAPIAEEDRTGRSSSTGTRIASAPQQPKAGGKGKVAAIVVVAVFAVLALGVGGFFVYQNFLAPQPEAEAEKTPANDDGSLTIDENSFPDEVMRAYVEENVDTDGDGAISEEEGAAVTSMDLDGVSSIDNLAYFPNLESLTVSADSPVENPVDVTENAKLSTLELPDYAVVEGLDSTQLREDWLPVNTVETIDGSEGYSCLVVRDTDGNVTSTDRGGNGATAISSTFTYDSAGNMTGRVSTANGYSTPYTYEYDGEGKMVRATWGSGNENIYEYDADGSLTGITQTVDGATTSASFQYDSEGRCTYKSYSDGSHEEWAYDADGRCTSYSYPTAEGNRTINVTYAEDKITASGSNGSVEYTLDADGNITEATSDSATATCTYDEHGNLTGATVTYDGGGQRTYSASYVRVFVSKDAKAPNLGAALEPSYGSDCFAIYPQTLPTVDINGLGLGFNRVTYYSTTI